MMSLNLIIIVLTVLVSIYAQNNTNLYGQLMMNPHEVMKKRQYWRLITSGFVHDGYSHLGFNMFTLYFLAVLWSNISVIFWDQMRPLYLFFSICRPLLFRICQDFLKIKIGLDTIR